MSFNIITFRKVTQEIDPLHGTPQALSLAFHARDVIICVSLGEVDKVLDAYNTLYAQYTYTSSCYDTLLYAGLRDKKCGSTNPPTNTTGVVMSTKLQLICTVQIHLQLI